MRTEIKGGAQDDGPGSLQRMVRRSSAAATHERLGSLCPLRSLWQKQWPQRTQRTRSEKRLPPRGLACGFRTRRARCHGGGVTRRRLTTQAQRPGPTGTLDRKGNMRTEIKGGAQDDGPGSLQRMVRRSSAAATHERLGSLCSLRSLWQKQWPQRTQRTQSEKRLPPRGLARGFRTRRVRCHGGGVTRRRLTAQAQR